MYTETEGIILKQTKIIKGRKMLVVFTKRFGKISAGTSIKANSKNRASLALRPFVYGNYQINKTGEYYHINGAEVISSHYHIGENIDKYMCASYVLELTEKLLPENASDPKLFLLLVSFLDMLERRSKKYETLVIAYQIKALTYSGNAPQLDACVICGEKEKITDFSVQEGGLVCKQCILQSGSNERLLYNMEFGMINVLRYLMGHPISSFDHLALDDEMLEKLQLILKDYLAYHLDISGLKSEELLDYL